MTYRIDGDARVVRVRGRGILRVADLLEFYSRLQTDPRFEPDFAGLGDLRDVVDVDFTSIDLALCAGTPIFDPTARRALVASRDNVYEMLRAFAAYSERIGGTVSVFRNLDRAVAWLDRGDEPLDD